MNLPVTKREKAEKIVRIYYGHTGSIANAINCAIIHVHGILEELEHRGIISTYWKGVLFELEKRNI